MDRHDKMFEIMQLYNACLKSPGKVAWKLWRIQIMLVVRHLSVNETTLTVAVNMEEVALKPINCNDVDSMIS